MPLGTGRRPGVYALRVLAAAAVLAVLAVGRAVLVPFAFSAVLAAVLVPFVDRLRRWHVPSAVAATVAVGTTVAVVALAAVLLEPPLRSAAAGVPAGLTAARTRLETLRAPLTRLARKLDGQAAPAPAAPRAAASTAPSSPPDSAAARLESRVLPTIRHLFGSTAALVGQGVSVLLLALYLLADGARWPDKLARLVRSPEARHTVVTTSAEARAVVTRYAVANLLINASQGVLIALTMRALGVPAAVLWGVLTTLLEFIPYFGGFVMVGMLLVTGLARGGSVLHMLLPAALYLVVTTVQNNLASPAAYGRALQLNPAVILVATTVGFALWGVGGAVLAVPIVAAVRVVATHVTSLAPLAVLLEP